MSITRLPISNDDPALRQQLNILRKPSHRRTKEDLHTLYKSFAGVQFFKELEQPVALQVCRMLRLEFFISGRTVFKEGDAGDQFYVILSGSIGVYIKEVSAQDVEVEDEEDLPEPRKGSVGFEDARAKLLTEAVGNRQQARIVEETEEDGSPKSKCEDDGDPQLSDASNSEVPDPQKRKRSRLKSILRSSGMMKSIADTLHELAGERRCSQNGEAHASDEEAASREKEDCNDTKVHTSDGEKHGSHDDHADSSDPEKDRSSHSHKEKYGSHHSDHNDNCDQQKHRSSHSHREKYSSHHSDHSDHDKHRGSHIHRDKRHHHHHSDHSDQEKHRSSHMRQDLPFAKRKARRSSTWSGGVKAGAPAFSFEARDLTHLGFHIEGVDLQVKSKVTLGLPGTQHSTPRSPRGSFAPTLSSKRSAAEELSNLMEAPQVVPAVRRTRRSSTWSGSVTNRGSQKGGLQLPNVVLMSGLSLVSSSSSELTAQEQQPPTQDIELAVSSASASAKQNLVSSLRRSVSWSSTSDAVDTKPGSQCGSDVAKDSELSGTAEGEIASRSSTNQEAKTGPGHSTSQVGNPSSGIEPVVELCKKGENVGEIASSVENVSQLGSSVEYAAHESTPDATDKTAVGIDSTSVVADDDTSSATHACSAPYESVLESTDEVTNVASIALTISTPEAHTSELKTKLSLQDAPELHLDAKTEVAADSSAVVASSQRIDSFGTATRSQGSDPHCTPPATVGEKKFRRRSILVADKSRQLPEREQALVAKKRQSVAMGCLPQIGDTPSSISSQRPQNESGARRVSIAHFHRALGVGFEASLPAASRRASVGLAFERSQTVPSTSQSVSSAIADAVDYLVEDVKDKPEGFTQFSRVATDVTFDRRASSNVRRFSLHATEQLSVEARTRAATLQSVLSEKASDRAPTADEWLQSMQPQITLPAAELKRRSLTLQSRRQSAPGATADQMKRWRRKSFFKARNLRRVSMGLSAHELDLEDEEGEEEEPDLDDIHEEESGSGGESDGNNVESASEQEKEGERISLDRRNSRQKRRSSTDSRRSSSSNQSSKRSSNSGRRRSNSWSSSSNSWSLISMHSPEEEEEENVTFGPARSIRGTAGGDQLKEHLDKLKNMEVSDHGDSDDSEKISGSTSDSDSSRTSEEEAGSTGSRRNSQRSSVRGSRASWKDDAYPEFEDYGSPRSSKKKTSSFADHEKEVIEFASDKLSKSPIPGDESGSKRLSISRRVSHSKVWMSKLQSAKRRISYLERMAVPKVMEVATIKAGGAFGEVALQTDQPRSATIKTKEDTYFATLSRNDFKAILQNSVEKQQRERQAFLDRQPILEGLSRHHVNKIAAMLQLRTLLKNECVFDFDAPVLQVFFAKEGEFKVCYKRSAPDPEEQTKDDDGGNHNSGGASSGVGRARSSILIAGSKKDDFTSPRKKKSVFVTVALVTPPNMFGLSGYIKGERRYNYKVVCSSVTGLVYCILAKELVHHLSRDLRDRLQVAAATEDRFYDNRLKVIRQLDAPLQRWRSLQGGARRWQVEQTMVDRIRIARGEIDNGLSAYSPEGRLKAIKNVLKPAENKNLDVLKALAKQEENQSTEEDEIGQIRTCWFMEELIAIESAAGPKYGIGATQRHVASQAPTDADTADLNDAEIERRAFAEASWANEKLKVAFSSKAFHSAQPRRRPRGRADGKRLAFRKGAGKRNQELRDKRAANSSRGDRSPAGSVSRCSSNSRPASSQSRGCSRERSPLRTAQGQPAGAEEVQLERMRKARKMERRLHTLYGSNMSGASTAALSDMSGFGGRSYVSLSNSVSMSSLPDAGEDVRLHTRKNSGASRRVQLPDLLSPCPASECIDAEGQEMSVSPDPQVGHRTKHLPELPLPSPATYSKPTTAETLSRALLHEMDDLRRQLEPLQAPQTCAEYEAEDERMMPTAETWKAMGFFADHLLEATALSNAPSPRKQQLHGPGFTPRDGRRKLEEFKEKPPAVLPLAGPSRQIFSQSCSWDRSRARAAGFSSAFSSAKARQRNMGDNLFKTV